MREGKKIGREHNFSVLMKKEESALDTHTSHTRVMTFVEFQVLGEKEN